MPSAGRLAPLEVMLDETRRALCDAIAGHPDEVLARAPAEGKWSAAQVVEHLGLVEAGVATVLRAMVEDADLEALGPDTGSDPVASVLDHIPIMDRTRKVQAPERVTPRAAGIDVPAAMARLTAARAEVKATLDRAGSYAVGRLTYPHPALGELTFHQWVVFLARHEARHTIQITEAIAAAREAA